MSKWGAPGAEVKHSEAAPLSFIGKRKRRFQLNSYMKHTRRMRNLSIVRYLLVVYTFYYLLLMDKSVNVTVVSLISCYLRHWTANVGNLGSTYAGTRHSCCCCWYCNERRKKQKQEIRKSWIKQLKTGANQVGGKYKHTYIRICQGQYIQNTGKQTHEGKRASCAAVATVCVCVWV